MNLLWFAAGIIVGSAMGLVITCAIVSNKDSRKLEREEDVNAW